MNRISRKPFQVHYRFTELTRQVEGQIAHEVNDRNWYKVWWKVGSVVKNRVWIQIVDQRHESN